MIGDVSAHIFVYGTLRPGGGAFHRFLAGYAVSHRAAVLEDHAIYGASLRYPFVTPEPGRRVHGDVISVPDSTLPELLEVLDDYEGGDYVRSRVEVTLEGADPVDAWAYLAFPDVALPPSERIESGDWLDR